MKTTKNQANAVRSYLRNLGMEISHVQALEVIARGEGLRSRHIKALDLKVSQGARVSEENAFVKAIGLQTEYCVSLTPSDLTATAQQLMAQFAELFNTEAAAAAFLEEGADESIGLYCEELSLAFAIRESYWESDLSKAALADALRKLVSGCSFMFKEYRSAYCFLVGAITQTPSPAIAKPQRFFESLVVCSCKKCDTDIDNEGYCRDSTCPYHDWPQTVPADDLSYYSTAVLEHKHRVKRRIAEEGTDKVQMK